MRTMTLAAVLFWLISTPLWAVAASNVKLSVNRSTQAVTAEVAAAKGFYKEQGLEVKTFAEDSGSVSLQAVVGGSADLAVGLHVRVIQGLAKQLPLCNVAMVQYGLTSEIVVPVNDKTSKSMTDLKGKRVGVQVGSGTYMAWRILIKAIGLQEKDFIVKHMKTNLIPAAFESRSLEAAVAWEPYSSIMVSKGLGRVLISRDEWSKKGKIVYPVLLFGNCAWVDTNKDTVQRFVNAWVKATRFIDKNRTETLDIMEKAYRSWGLKIPRDKINEGIYTRGYEKLLFDDEVIKDSENFAELMHETKQIKILPDIKKAMRPEFVKKAIESKM